MSNDLRSLDGNQMECRRHGKFCEASLDAAYEISGLTPSRSPSGWKGATLDEAGRISTRIWRQAQTGQSCEGPLCSDLTVNGAEERSPPGVPAA